MTEPICYNCLGRAKYACRACRSAEYCSRECQRTHWLEYHRHDCQLVSPSENDDRSTKMYIAARTGPKCGDRGENSHCGMELTESVPACMAKTITDQKWGMFRTVPLLKLRFDERKYVLLKSFGRGSFGQVTQRRRIQSPPKSRRPPPTDIVAVKIINSAPIVEGAAATPFAHALVYPDVSRVLTRELELRNFDHPNVVGICEAGFIEPPPDNTGKFAVVMDPADGDLHHYLLEWKQSPGAARTASPFPREMDTAFVMYQVLRGIEHMHKNLVINFDIKSANVLMFGAASGARKRDGTAAAIWPLAKISDMGLSSAYYVRPMLMGEPYTVPYRPPEFLLSDGNLAWYTAETWAAAAVMYEIATGDTLFPGGDNVTATLASVIGKLGPVVAKDAGNMRKWFSKWDPGKFFSTEYAFDWTIRAEINKTGTPHADDLANLLRRMLTYDPELRPSISDVLGDVYFENTGAAGRWKAMYKMILKEPGIGEPPELAEKHPEYMPNGAVSPKWALAIFTRRETEFRGVWIPKSIEAQKSEDGDKMQIFREAAVRLFMLGATNLDPNTAITVPVLFAALEFLRWYSVRAQLNILRGSWAVDRCRALTAACLRLAGLYRSYSRQRSLPSYQKFWKSDALNDIPQCLSEGSICMEQRRVLEKLDFNLAMPSIFDFIEQTAYDKYPRNAADGAELVPPNLVHCAALCASMLMNLINTLFYVPSEIAAQCYAYVNSELSGRNVPAAVQEIGMFRGITKILQSYYARPFDPYLRAWESGHQKPVVDELRQIYEKILKKYPL